MVDDAQYQNRLRNFDFDMIIDQWGESLSPGNEQREFWGSQAADQPGSRNTVGIKNPAVDALIEAVIFAKDRAELVAATQGAGPRAAVEFLRRAAIHLSDSQRYARWDRFSHAEPLPKYGRSGLPSLWWFDADKAAKIGKRSLRDILRMAHLSRRHVLGLGVGALSAPLLRPARRRPTGSCRDRTGCRCSAT